MFQKIQKKIKEFLNEKGQGIVEYALILGFVGIIAIALISKSGLRNSVEADIGAVKGQVDAISAQVVSANL